MSRAVGTKDKELFKISNATHIEMYWKSEYVNQAMDKFTVFYGEKLK